MHSFGESLIDGACLLDLQLQSFVDFGLPFQMELQLGQFVVAASARLQAGQLNLVGLDHSGDSCLVALG